MALLRLHNIGIRRGGPILLDGVDLTLERGERVCLIGRNGEGKSTLLHIIAGSVAADDGEVSRRQGLRIALLEQEAPPDLTGRVVDLCRDALGEAGECLGQYQRALAEEADIARIDALQKRIDELDGWRLEQSVERILTRLQLDPELRFDTLSGGMKRRVLLARALVREPDVLLLDEPTNHLDISAVEYLEKFLLEFPGALLFVTHDRAFLRRLATRIILLDRGGVSSWPGDYERFLRSRQEALEAEERQRAEFDKKLAREEVWIRQGIKARRTRNEGRVRDLKKLRQAHAQRREQVGRVNIAAQLTNPSGKVVISTENLSYSVGATLIVRDFSTLIQRGDKIALIGPNGVGKTTLIRLLLKRLAPDSGRVDHGSQLQLAYFDQLREQLNPALSAQENVAGGREMLTINGKPRHAISYMQDFLFSPARARAPITALSGGERNRLLLAKIFSQPSNLLVLDEPTNDLDIETLELLEEQLMQYAGTILLVSHDRAFIDNIATSTLVFTRIDESKAGGARTGEVCEYVGGYSDWLRQCPVVPAGGAAASAPVERGGEQSKGRSSKASRDSDGDRQKLSYKEQRELASLPSTIEALEGEQSDLEARMAQADFYRQEGERVAAAQQRYHEVGAQLEQLYARWEQLER